MEISRPIGPGDAHPPHHEPSKPSGELHAKVQEWLDNVKNLGYITPTDYEERSKALAYHPDPKSVEQLAVDLYTHLPADAPKPPIPGVNGHSNSLPQTFIDALSKTPPEAVVRSLETLFHLPDARTLLKDTNCVYEKDGILQWSSVHSFLDFIEHPSDAPPAARTISAALHNAPDNIISQATQEFKTKSQI